MATTDPHEPEDHSTLSAAPFDDLLSEVLLRVKDARDEQVRWQLLLEAVVSMAAGLSLDDLLRRIVDVARDLVQARYGALGVLSNSGPRRLRLFITSGLTEDQTAAIGALPTGHGVLGLLIDRPEPVRLHDITMHPNAYGFPAEHPPMHSFLGVPVRSAGKVFGNLYLAEKEGGGDFTPQDEEIVTALAAAAGVAIENARLHEDAARRERWLDARTRIMTALMDDLDRPAALQLVADQARSIADADLAWIMTGPDPDALKVEVVSGIELEPAQLDAPLTQHPIASSAVRAGTPLTVADLSAEPDQLGISDVVDLSTIGPAVMVPLQGADVSGGENAAGILALAWTHENAGRSRDVDLLVANAFAEQVTIALRFASSRLDQQRLAVYGDRERISRDLHDVVIQRLFAIGLRLQAALNTATEESVRTRLDQSVDDLDETINNIRKTIFQLGNLDRSGDLMASITQEIDRAAHLLGFRPEVQFSGPIRRGVPIAVGEDALAVLAEALSNVVRHAEASAVWISVTAGSDLVLEVRDNGVGMPVTASESGLANMRRRAIDRGGRCTIGPAEPRGTAICWSVPLL